LVNNNEVLAEIGVVVEQQHLTEQEESEIQRQQHLLEVQGLFAATLKADLDALRFLFPSAVPPTTQTSHQHQWATTRRRNSYAETVSSRRTDIAYCGPSR
jgi:hypothetical protein